jgi:hypothetical protein
MMKGSCLCGAIEVSAPDHKDIGLCHCSMCRRWSGGPMFAVHCGPGVTFSGKQQPARYKSSEWAERGFCAVCGTHLFYHLLPTDEYMLPAGIFGDAVDFRLASQIFIDEKPDYYDLSNKTPMLTGEQVFAQFTEGQG